MKLTAIFIVIHLFFLSAAFCEEINIDDFQRRQVKVTDPNDPGEVAGALVGKKEEEAKKGAGLDPKQKDKAFPIRRGVASTPKFSEQVLYDSVRQKETVSDVGCVLKDTPDGKTILEVSILTTGRGANFRRWMPQGPYLLLDSQRIIPIKTEKFYASKESVLRGVAPIVFAAIGTQYVGYSKDAAAAPGEACPVEHEGTAKAIDRVGMAAGLGLLTSQAKGQITGLKTTYDVTASRQFIFKTLLKFQAANNTTRQAIDVIMPLRFPQSAADE